MLESIKAMITGKAIYPVSTDELNVLLGDSHSTLRLTAEPDEAVEEFMRRAFNDALSIEHVAQSTWQCIIYISPKWQKLSENAINELETYIDSAWTLRNGYHGEYTKMLLFILRKYS